MEPYDCDYTWDEVKEAVNRCLLVIYNRNEGDCVKEIFDNAIHNAMNTVSRQVFIHGDYSFSSGDLSLIRQAYKQIDKVGYIGMATVKDMRKNNEKVSDL